MICNMMTFGLARLRENNLTRVTMRPVIAIRRESAPSTRRIGQALPG